MIEEWRPVVGYEGSYEVSNLGRVRSLDRYTPYRDSQRLMRGRVLSPHVNRSGYPTVSLGRGNVLGVHQLVLAAFRGERPEGTVSRHLNDVKTDNRLENLVYGTPKENSRDCVDNGHSFYRNKTHCPQGHEYTPENTYWTKGKRRHCRECTLTRQRSRRRSLRSAEAPAQELAPESSLQVGCDA